MRSWGTVCWAGEGDSNAIPFPHTPIPASTRQGPKRLVSRSVFGPRTHYKPALAAPQFMKYPAGLAGESACPTFNAGRRRLQSRAKTSAASRRRSGIRDR
jgi:hypothetical protein